MKLTLIVILSIVLGFFIGLLSVRTYELYRPIIIHDTINKRVDSIITIENTITKTIFKTKLIHDHKKDSIIHLPDSFQFDLFRANCERYQYLYSNDSATAN